MTEHEFKDALKSLGLTQRKFSADTGMAAITVNKWANGRARVPGIAAAYIRLRLKAKDLIE